jgi:hypothetical protein
MKNITIKLCVAVVFALAAMAAQAQTCTTPDATLISPTNGAVLQLGTLTFSWCNASADYFVTIESVPGAHDIFFAFTGGAGGGAGQNFLSLPVVTLPSLSCATVSPTGCIPALGETIYFTLQTVKAKQILGTHQYTFTAAGGGTGAAGFSPNSLSAGSALVGATSGVRKVTLSNVGTGNLTIHSVTASGDFSETDTCTGQTLLPSATCDISVTFTPSVTGIVPGALTISDNTPQSPHIVALSGTGLGSVSLAPASLSFGTVTVGTHSTPKTMTLTNNTSGSLGYTFLASANYTAAGSGTQPCTGVLAGKAKCTMSVAFTPTANGAANGSLAVSSASFATQLAGLSGTGSAGGTSPLTFSPLTQSFASTLIGTASAAKTVTVTNSSVSPVNITNFVASGDFSVVGSGTTPCGGVLGAGASCTAAVAFHPSVPGSIKGSVTLMDNAPVNTQLYNIMGKAVLPVSFSPTSLTFAAQTVGTTSAPKIVTLTNNQAIALTLTSVVASGQYTAAAGGTTPCGSTVNAHSSCTFAVTFSPKQPVAIPGVVTVTHNAASGNPQVIKLSGTGQ